MVFSFHFIFLACSVLCCNPPVKPSAALSISGHQQGWSGEYKEMALSSHAWRSEDLEKESFVLGGENVGYGRGVKRGEKRKSKRSVISGVTNFLSRQKKAHIFVGVLNENDNNRRWRQSVKRGPNHRRTSGALFVSLSRSPWRVTYPFRVSLSGWFTYLFILLLICVQEEEQASSQLHEPCPRRVRQKVGFLGRKKEEKKKN